MLGSIGRLAGAKVLLEAREVLYPAGQSELGQNMGQVYQGSWLWEHLVRLSGLVWSSPGDVAIAVPWQSGCVSLAWVWGEQPKAHCGGLAAGLEHLNCIPAHALCVKREHKHWYSLAPPIPQSSHRA